MKKAISIIFILFLMTHVSSAQEKVQSGYSTSILKNPQHSYADLLLESTELNNFLNENGTGLSSRFKRDQRLKLYALINSYVINNFQSQGTIIPKDHDTLLTGMFSWAGELGVYGGNTIYNTLKDSDTPAQITKNKVPNQYELTFNQDLLTLASPSFNWKVSVPYYFMITSLYNAINQGGNDTQIVSIATGFAKNSDLSSEYSQGNIMLLHAKNADHGMFSTHWLAETGLVSGSRRKKAAIHQSHYTFDADYGLHKELVIFKRGSSSFAIFYSGLEGPYQANRPHFLSFINALKVTN